MFKVEEFDRERFIKLFSEQTNQKYISRKNIIKFLEKFFKRHSLSGKAPNNQILIVIEEHYLSQSYIDDIVAYHSSSFQKFEKFCKRLHFFKKGDNLPFHDQKSLEKYLKNEKHSSNEILNDRYLGYIVVKPITKAPIGAILVKPWNEQDASKSNIVKSLVDETVNFFGISISFKSLAMQPQDPSVSICTVNSIWCVLHYGWKHFKIPMVSPAKITEKAGSTMEVGRNYPIGNRKGFSTAQVCSILKKFDLQPEIFELAKDQQLLELKRIVYAYNKSGFPILLGYTFPKDKNIPDIIEEPHMVTICGFKVNKYDYVKYSSHLTLKAYNISEIVVHDDQLGPFASIKVDDNILDSEARMKVHGVWDIEGETSGDIPVVQANITSLIVPVPDAIRIRYDIVEKVAKKFIEIFEIDSSKFNPSGEEDQIFIELVNDTRSEVLQKEEWEIFLIKSNEYKANCRLENSTKNTAYKIRTSSYPFYIWIASMSVSGKKLVDLVFDTTGSPEGDCLYQINYFDEAYKSYIQLMINAINKLSNPNELGDEYPHRLKKCIEKHLSFSNSDMCFKEYHNYTSDNK